MSNWKRASFGAIPFEANRSIGYEAPVSRTRPVLYLVRTEHEAGIHPGKIKSGWNGANISWGGEEIPGKKHYEVYCGPNPNYRNVSLINRESFISQSGDSMIGNENGQALYAIRADWGDGKHIGKISAGWSSGLIPYGGDEIPVNNFEVIQIHNFMPKIRLSIVVLDGVRRNSILSAKVKLKSGTEFNSNLISGGAEFSDYSSRQFNINLDQATHIDMLDKFELEFHTGSTGTWGEVGDDIHISKMIIEFVDFENTSTIIFTKQAFQFEDHGLLEVQF
jgi:hypothetical protein